MLLFTSLFFSLAAWANQCSTILEGYQSLADSHSYAFVDLPVGSWDQNWSSAVKLSKSGEYNRFGDLQHLTNGLPEFLTSIGVSDPSNQQSIVEASNRIVGEVMLATGSESAWVAFRAFKSTSVFDIPRWHTDGRFFISPNRQAKFATVFLGPPTIFVSPEQELRKEFLSIQRRQDISSDEKQRRLAELLAQVPVEQPLRGQGSWFMVGNDFAAIHSEPMIHGDRFFISVVPGSHAQIADLKNRWGL